MQTVIIVMHLMVIVALVAVVLLQRSEGGALGIGGSNNLMTSRGQGNVLTKATTFLGIAFFATSIAMTVLSRLTAPPSSILDEVPANVAPATAPAEGTDGTAGGILDQLEEFTGESLGDDTSAEQLAPPAEPQVPTSQ
jgi:preprotein translocase subunit SecG